MPITILEMFIARLDWRRVRSFIFLTYKHQNLKHTWYTMIYFKAIVYFLLGESAFGQYV